MVMVTAHGYTYGMDGYLKSNLDTTKNVIKKDWDFLFLVTGNEGCLAGDTLININRNELGRPLTIRRLYNQYHDNPDKIRRYKKWDLTRPTYVRSYNGKEIRLHPIHNVVYSGKRHTYKLELQNGNTLTATADHQIQTDKGFIQLQYLTPDHHIMLDSLRATPKGRKTCKLYDVQLSVQYHKYGNRRIEIHRLIYEAHLNGLHLTTFLDLLLNEPEASKKLLYIDPTTHHVHHRDGNHYNNDINNLQLIPKDEHLLLHGQYQNFSQGIPSWTKFKSLTYHSFEDTYDIICHDPNHNFVANGIVVHNSGKSVLTQQCAAYTSENKWGTKQISFTPNEFKQAILAAPKYSSVVYDEAFRGLNARQTLTQTNITIVSMLAEIRQRNLFVYIVLPSFFDLDRYVALHRSCALIHVYTGDNFERGYFAFYNRERKKELYLLGKKLYSYTHPKPNFIGRFSNHYTVDEDEYRRLKLEAVRRYDQTHDYLADSPPVRVAILKRLLKLNPTLPHKLTQQQMGKILNLTHARVNQLMKDERLSPET